MQRICQIIGGSSFLPVAATICLLVVTGCRESAQQPSERTTTTGSSNATASDPNSGSSLAEGGDVPQLEKSSGGYQSAIRLEPLPLKQFPEVIPDNGARHGFATILESLGSGCAAVDFDRDDLPDAIIAGGGDFVERMCVGRPVHFLRNRRTHFEDTTNCSGIGTTRYYHHGICAADYDGDGFEDILVTGYDGMQLFCNQGDGTFQEAAEAGDIVPEGWSASAAWGDFNRDGLLDVYITGYVNWSFDNDPPCFAADGITRDNCSPKLFEALPDSLLINDGDGTFTDQTLEFQVRPDGKTLGVVAADLNADGFLDLYVGNDVMMNFLYRNEGGRKFADWSMFGGAGGSRRGSPDASMGVDVVDFNNDGRFDIWAANFEMESFALYKNLGDMQFRHVSDVTGVSAIGGQYVGWGTAFADLDLDGDCDTVVCNGNVVMHPKHSPTLQKMVLLENIDGEYFEDVTEQTGAALMTPQHGRGLAWTDFDRDGDIDLITSPTHAPAQLLKNVTVANGSSLTLRLIGTESPRQPIGAVATLVTSKGVQTKQLIGGGSYASTSLAEIYFGVADGASLHELKILWPSGRQRVIPLTDDDYRLALVEGKPVEN